MPRLAPVDPFHKHAHASPATTCVTTSTEQISPLETASGHIAKRKQSLVSKRQQMFPCIVAGPSSTASIDYHTYKGPSVFLSRNESRVNRFKHFCAVFPMPQERRIESLTARDSPIRPRVFLR
jgi:hypothetical protein